MSDPNVTAFNNYKTFWRNVVVQSGQVGRAFWPYYDIYVNKVTVPTPGISEADFNRRVNTLANNIRVYFVNAQYSGNKEVLAQQIEASKPKYTARVQVKAAPAARTQVPTVTTVVADRIFKGEGGIAPAVDYRTTFESMKALANSDVMDIEGLLKGTAAPAALAAISAKVDAEIAAVEKKKMARQAAIDALNQQFVDERSTAGKVDKPKVMVLQDWILVAFAVAYIFFGVVAIIYVSSKSEYPMRAGIAMAALMVVVTAVMYSWVSYLA